MSDYETEGGKIIRPVFMDQSLEFMDSSLEVSQTQLWQINLPGERLWFPLKHFDPIII